jgi:hypothetical protein
MRHPAFKLVYLIIPVLFLVIAVYLRDVTGLYHTDGVDPEYAFLYNGLNIALLKLRIWHMQHPATPLQLLCGLVIRITHLVLGKGPIVNDVLNRPEFYLSGISYTLFVLLAASNAALGYFGHKFTGQPVLSLLIQMGPFLSTMVAGPIFRVALEPMLIITVQIYAIYLLYLLKINYTRKHIIIFAVITALSVATKVNSFSLAVIPLFLFINARERLLYLGSVILAFFVLAFPVVLRINQYFLWIKSLIVHSRQYGSGENKVVDWPYFVHNLKSMFVNEWLWTVFLIVLGLGVLLMFLPLISQKLFADNPKNKKTLTGIIVAFLLLFIVVAKHYAYWYMMPALMLILPAVAILLMTLKSVYLKNALAAISIVAIIVIQGNNIPVMLKGYKERNLDRKMTSEFARENFSKEDPLLLVPNYYGHAFLQYALYFGSWWSGPDHRELVYQEQLKRMYPDTYIYNPVEKFFHFWGKKVQVGEILANHPNLYISVGWDMEKPFQDVLSIIDTVTTDFTLDTIFTNKRSSEEIYLMTQHRTEDLPGR